LLEMDISVGAADQHGTLGNVTIWGISIVFLVSGGRFGRHRHHLTVESVDLSLAHAKLVAVMIWPAPISHLAVIELLVPLGLA
jgi:hypothetical protein